MAARRSATEASKPRDSLCASFCFFLQLEKIHTCRGESSEHLEFSSLAFSSSSLSCSLDASAPHALIYRTLAAAALWSLRCFSLAAAGA